MFGRFSAVLATLLVIALMMSGCGSKGQPSAVTGLAGAGATFPYPLYSKMFDTYDGVTGVRVNYNSIGSGGGIKALTDKTVDFGASDAFLNDQEAAAMGAPVLHIPTCVGAVVLSYNLDGNPALKLDGTVTANIFLGKVTKWNDPSIAALNPGVSLPAPRHHGRPPLGRLRHHVHLHQLPGSRQPVMEVDSRRRQVRELAGRRRRQGQRRRRGHDLADEG